MAVGKYQVLYRDYGGETSPFSVFCVELTAGNFAATGTALQALGTATNALSRGQPAKSTLIAQINTISGANAADPVAQREMKWLVTYADDVTNKLYTLEIPCADLTAANLAGNSDEADLTSTEWAAWVTAFEAVAKSEVGNAVSVVRARFVGRNL
jgi:hypothetical protein